MGDLELLPLTAHHRPVLAPVELERFARCEHQRHERPATGFLRGFPLRSTEDNLRAMVKAEIFARRATRARFRAAGGEIIDQGLVLFFSLSYVTVNLAVDLSYLWLDPRIRY
mgnify:CR=1 FL=1